METHRKREAKQIEMYQKQEKQFDLMRWVTDTNIQRWCIVSIYTEIYQLIRKTNIGITI